MKDAPGATRKDPNAFAQMSCELADGRKITMDLTGYEDGNDDRAKLTVVLE